jgi:hypothetical protein
MSEAYEEIVNGETLLRSPPDLRHELVCERLHSVVARGVSRAVTSRLLPPRSIVQIAPGTFVPTWRWSPPPTAGCGWWPKSSTPRITGPTRSSKRQFTRSSISRDSGWWIPGTTMWRCTTAALTDWRCGGFSPVVRCCRRLCFRRSKSACRRCSNREAEIAKASIRLFVK